MARGDALKAQLAARIRASATTLTITYPPLRQQPVINTPEMGEPRPVSPLTGPRTTATMVPVEVTPAKPAVTDIKCLWLDAVVNAMQGREAIDTKLEVGWRAEADAMARVLIEDTALDPDDPYGGTVFDGSDVVLCHGKRWKLVAVEPIGHSFTAPSTYAVWLRGSAKD